MNRRELLKRAAAAAAAASMARGVKAAGSPTRWNGRTPLVGIVPRPPLAPFACAWDDIRREIAWTLGEEEGMPGFPAVRMHHRRGSSEPADGKPYSPRYMYQDTFDFEADLPRGCLRGEVAVVYYDGAPAATFTILPAIDGV